MPTIFVSVNGNSGNLRLRDSQGHDPGNSDLTTFVSPDNIVTWEIDPAPPPGARPVASIERVYKKPNNDPNNYSLLTDEPTNTGNGVFQATVVKRSPGSGKQLFYNIDFKLDPGGPTLTDDPKLQMQ